jgi:hypothetical protein
MQVELEPFNANGTANNDLDFTALTESPFDQGFQFTGQNGSGLTGGSGTIQISDPGGLVPGHYDTADGLVIAIFGSGEGGVPNCTEQTGSVTVDQALYTPNGTPTQIGLRFVVDCLDLQTQTQTPFYQGTLA